MEKNLSPSLISSFIPVFIDSIDPGVPAKKEGKRKGKGEEEERPIPLPPSQLEKLALYYLDHFSPSTALKGRTT